MKNKELFLEPQKSYSHVITINYIALVHYQIDGTCAGIPFSFPFPFPFFFLDKVLCFIIDKYKQE